MAWQDINNIYIYIYIYIFHGFTNSLIVDLEYNGNNQYWDKMKHMTERYEYNIE